MTSDHDLAQIGGDKIDPRVWKIVAVVILGTIMAALDTTMVNIALEQLSRELHSSLTDVQWVVSAYLLAMAAVVPAAAWATRRFGTTRMYLATIVVFTAGSLLCGIATSTPELVAFRVIQGLGGGMMMPVGQMIIVKAAGPRHLSRVMGVWGATVLLGPVLGPTLGGLVLDISSWRWIFYVNIPLGIVAVVLGRRRLPANAPEPAGRLDVLGWFLVAGGSVGLTYALAELGSTADRLTHVAVPLAVGIMIMAVFVIRGLRIERPLLDLRLYANKAFTASSLTTFCIAGLVLIGSLILMPLYFQIVRHDNPLHTGLLLAPRGVGTALAMWLSGRVSERIGAGTTAVSGSLLTILASIPFVMIGTDHFVHGSRHDHVGTGLRDGFGRNARHDGGVPNLASQPGQ